MTNAALALDAQALVNAITTHGLMVRQIPLEIVERWNITTSNEKNIPADAEIEVIMPDLAYFNGNQARFNDFYRYNPNGRRVRVERRVPAHAGYWLTKQATHSMSQIHWDIKEDCLAATLEQSVALWLQNNAQ